MKIFKKGFTLIELMVVVSIISILSAVLYANFSDARAQSRDKARMSELKQVQLALEMYKAQNDTYPTQGCGPATSFAGPGPASASGFSSCANYINSLVPDYITELPTDDVFETINNRGYFYRSNGDHYKLMAYDVLESMTMVRGDEFARCPVLAGACAAGIPPTTMAVYSVGAETW